VFSRELIQAVSDWQRGFDAKQKLKRAAALKAVAAGLDERFRRVDAPCYRQVSLDPGSVWRIGDDLRLSESVSSWTESRAVAEEFKGGVPPPGWQGVILRVEPDPSQVVVNLAALFSEKEFAAAVEREKSAIVGYYDGMGQYGEKQQEVVLELETVPLSSVDAVGGFSSSKEELARIFYGRTPTPNDLTAFEALLAQSKHTIGPVWLRGDGMMRGFDVMLKFVEANRERHAAQRNQSSS
jgi:hypothetical protein